MFCSSMYPSSRRASRIALERLDSEEGESDDRYPIRAIVFGCCAFDGNAKRKEQEPRDSSRHVFLSVSSTRHSTLDTRSFSLDHLIRPRQHVGWNRQANLFRGFEVNH